MTKKTHKMIFIKLTDDLKKINDEYFDDYQWLKRRKMICIQLTDKLRIFNDNHQWRKMMKSLKRLKKWSAVNFLISLKFSMIITVIIINNQHNANTMQTKKFKVSLWSYLTQNKTKQELWPPRYNLPRHRDHLNMIISNFHESCKLRLKPAWSGAKTFIKLNENPRN